MKLILILAGVFFTVIKSLGQGTQIADPKWTYEQRKLYYSERLFLNKELKKKLAQIEAEEKVKRDRIHDAFKVRQAEHNATFKGHQAKHNAAYSAEKKKLDDELARQMSALNDETKSKQAIIDADMKGQISEIDAEEKQRVALQIKSSDDLLITKLTGGKGLSPDKTNAVVFGKPVEVRKTPEVASTIKKSGRQPASTGYVIPTNIDDKDEVK